MNEVLLDELLFKSEGSDLDYKSKQYRFIGASDLQKSELLKDILAMANARRTGPAYILIGFQENPPHPATVVGIQDHLDDADLQQFINSKATPKVDFKYQELMYRDLPVGVISIPKQVRPFYVKQKFGVVNSSVVYLRRGSSTDEAEPPEVAKMMAADAGRRPAAVAFAVHDKEGKLLASPYRIRLLDFGVLTDLPDYSERGPAGPLGLQVPDVLGQANASYWRDLAKWLQVGLAQVPFHFSVGNDGEAALSDCKIEVRVDSSGGEPTSLLAQSNAPQAPRRHWSPADNLRFGIHSLHKQSTSVTVERAADGDVGVLRIAKLLPGEKIPLGDYLAALPTAATTLRLRARLMASELSVPLSFEETFMVEATSEKYTMDDLKRFSSKR